MHPSIPKPSKVSLPLAAQNGALDAVTSPGTAAATQNKIIALDIIKHAERITFFWWRYAKELLLKYRQDTI